MWQTQKQWSNWCWYKCEHEVLRKQSKTIIYNVYMFSKKLSMDDECVKMDFLKTQARTVQAVYIQYHDL
jgi:hypothetical protein